ncbi:MULTISPECIES: terminase small subunit [unclassified Gemella]|uniref:terminase small subunit n=1 Tax=Gemella sp. oral taxon 928 TaxID=1785995 RepID=UPI0009EC616E|nr:terminase small subunit [Gemella sp. oral taxon 928]
MAKLTLKQQRFADEYIISGNATKAAIKAGYSEKTANRIATENLSKPVIKAYIDERLDELNSKKIANQQEVHEYLTSVMRGEQTEQILRSVGDYKQEITDIAVSAKDRLKAADLLNKIHQAREDKNVTSTEKIVIVDRWQDE